MICFSCVDAENAVGITVNCTVGVYEGLLSVCVEGICGIDEGG